MSRRNDTPVPTFHAPRTPEPAAPPRAKAVPAPVPKTAPTSEPVKIPPGQFFATKEEIREAWEKSRKLGQCVVCGCKIRSGFEGHISKCLRLSKFKTASTPTS